MSPSIQKEMEAVFFSEAARQLKQDGAWLKKATLQILLSHRFDVSFFIDSHYEQRNS